MKKLLDHKQMEICVADTYEEMNQCVLKEFKSVLNALLSRKEEVNIIFSGGGPQSGFLKAVSGLKDIDWQRVNAFAVDDFYDPRMPDDLTVISQLRHDLFDHVPFKSANHIDPKAPDPEKERMRYSKLLRDHPVDIAQLGIGMSGHIGLNEPGETDFDDKENVRLIHVCKRSVDQLKHDPYYNKYGPVPERGITITASFIMRAEHIFVLVPFENKAEIVKHFFENEISSELPATVLRRKQHGVKLYFDKESSSLTGFLQS